MPPRSSLQLERHGTATFWARSCLLKAEAGGASDPNRVELVGPDGAKFEAVWIQVAAAGTYKGHSSGEFTLNAGVFKQLIANFRASKSYSLGPDGFGIADVVAYDFHHASEAPATSVAISGTPAQAWALDLEMRAGGTELWALTRYLEPARSYVRASKYKWTSVCLWPDAVDPVTGESIGWLISSIAFTNDPFIKGMAPIAATGTAGREGVRLALTMTAEGALQELRWIFGLKDVDGLEVAIAGLEMIRTYSVGGALPPVGVDVGALLARVRDMLRLPLLTALADLFVHVDALIAWLRRDLANGTPSPPLTPATTPLARRSQETRTMDPKLIALSQKLACEATPDALHHRVHVLLEEKGKLGSQIAAIASLLGVSDANPDAIIEAARARIADAKTLAEVLPELEASQTEEADEEDKDAVADIEATMRAHGMAETYRPLLAHMRTAGVAIPRELNGRPNAKHPSMRVALSTRRRARQAFRAAYPLAQPNPAPGQQHLLQPVVTTPPGQGAGGGYVSPLLAGMSFGARGEPLLGAPPPAAPVVGTPAINAGGRVDLSSYPGANVHEQAIAHVRAQPGGDKLSFEDAHVRASLLLESHAA